VCCRHFCFGAGATILIRGAAVSIGALITVVIAAVAGTISAYTVVTLVCFAHETRARNIIAPVAIIGAAITVAFCACAVIAFVGFTHVAGTARAVVSCVFSLDVALIASNIIFHYLSWTLVATGRNEDDEQNETKVF
jgi:hypothetical protein